MSDSSNSAFPGGVYNSNGMTKREYAAVQILAAMAQSTAPGLLPSVADAVNLADRLFAQLKSTEK